MRIFSGSGVKKLLHIHTEQRVDVETRLSYPAITGDKLLAAVPGGVLQGNVTLHLTRVGGHLLQNLCRPEAELTQARNRGRYRACLYVFLKVGLVCACHRMCK